MAKLLIMINTLLIMIYISQDALTTAPAWILQEKGV